MKNLKWTSEKRETFEKKDCKHEKKEKAVVTIWQLFCFNSKINIQTSLRGISQIFGISYATVYGIFSRQIQGTRTHKYNKAGPKTAEDSREKRETIRNLRFNPQNTLKCLKLETNYPKSRVSSRRILKNQGFHRRLAIQDVLTNLLLKEKSRLGKKTSFKAGCGLFFRTSASSTLERHQKRRNFTSIDKMG